MSNGSVTLSVYGFWCPATEGTHGTALAVWKRLSGCASVVSHELAVTVYVLSSSVMTHGVGSFSVAGSHTLFVSVVHAIVSAYSVPHVVHAVHMASEAGVHAVDA